MHPCVNMIRNAMIHALLLASIFLPSVGAGTIDLIFDDDFAINNTALEADLTTCTITSSKRTQIMTCTFDRPKTNTAVCTRSYGSADDSPPLRLRIDGITNVTYVPESPESMLNIFIARDLYRDRKEVLAKGKRAVAAPDPFSNLDTAELDSKRMDVATKLRKELKIWLIVILTALCLYIFLVIGVNIRHMLTVVSTDQKTFLSQLLERNEIVDQIQECDREKKRLEEQLAQFDLDNHEDDGSSH